MYSIILLLHSWVRWIAIVSGVGATVAALNAPEPNAAPRGDRWGLFFVMALDLQFVLGLVLYVALSPFTRQAMEDFGGAMRNPQLRFWAVEHAASMVAAVVLVLVGRVLARKARTPESKRARLLVCYGFATLLMLLLTPWPGLANGRPLFRF